ncbi:MAG TPA: hypothetical protein VG797_05355 [Phycisphaerales bacterium]|nr:hypothetical protein [Phycisphaerales bacterium]
MNIIVILIVLGSGAAWASKARGFGLFSAFLGLVCTIAAGAIAFAIWEPLAYYVMGQAGTSAGWRFLEDSTWGLSLILPFIVSLIVLRLGVDMFVTKNLDFSDTTNMLGGAVLGAASGVVAAGIVVISLGFMRLPPDALGYQLVTVDRDGNATADGGLWLPADRIVATLYGHLSESSFSTDTPLAVFQPDVHEQAARFRMTYEGKSRPTVKPSEVQLLGRYTVTGKVNDLLSDAFLLDPSGKPKPQTVKDAAGNSPPEGSTLLGCVVNFRSGAKEKSGSVIVTPSQLRLIGTDADGHPFTAHPFAVVAPPDAVGVGLYRFRFNDKSPFIASLGGSSEAAFAFEFLVPPNGTPTHLVIKNDRFELTGDAKKKFKAVQERDQGVRDRSLFTAMGAATTDAKPATASTSGGSTPSGGSSSSSTAADAGNVVVFNAGVNNQIEGVSRIATLPFNIILNKSAVKGLEIGGKNGIRDGQSSFDTKETEIRNLGQELRVDSFEKTKDTGIVQLTLSTDGARSLLGRSVEAAEDILAPLLVDDAGRTYEALGYVYKAGGTIDIRFTPDRPLRTLSEVPALSRGKRDQSLVLVFRPTAGVTITAFQLGSKVVARFEGGMKVQN